MYGAMVKREKLQKRDIFILLVAITYIVFNLLVSYVELNRYFLISLMILGVLSSPLYSTAPLGWMRRVLTFFIALLLEVGILLISGFLFESNLVLAARDNLFETGEAIVKLYCMIGVLVIQNILNVLIPPTERPHRTQPT